MKVFITNKCLTGLGIQECEAKNAEHKTGHGVGTVEIERAYGSEYIDIGDWFSTRESAVARAIEIRDKKIASLRKQIAKLEAMTFE